jgi:general secretion pathway protein D
VTTQPSFIRQTTLSFQLTKVHVVRGESDPPQELAKRAFSLIGEPVISDIPTPKRKDRLPTLGIYNQPMRRNPALFGLATMLLLVALSGVALCTDQPQSPGPCTTVGASTTPCAISPQDEKKDLKRAAHLFKHGVQLQEQQRDEDALDAFTEASHLEPRNVEYATALAVMQQQLVFRYLQQGNQAMLNNKMTEAQAAFHQALQLDPSNEFARQRVEESLHDSIPRIQGPPQIVIDSPPVELRPDTSLHDFHFRGDSRTLLEQIARAYGVSVEMDESVTSKRVWFDEDQVDFFTAMRTAGQLTKTFWSALETKQVIIAADTNDNHKQFDKMGLRTFYFPGVTQATELNDIAISMRTIFDIRFMSQQPNLGTVEIRAPQDLIDAATKFVEHLDDSRPQVMLSVDIFQVSHTLMREVGVHIPNNFNVYNIPAAALVALGGQSLDSLLNQLASGGLTQGTPAALAGLLSQLQSGQGIFSQPLATFGGGLSFSGVTLDHLSAALSLNESSVRSMQHATLRAGDSSDAILKIGERYPILTSSFSTSFSSPQISQLLGAAGLGTGASLQTPFPSFSYEDIGLNIKAKPAIFSDSTVGLALELQLRSIGAQSVNGVPVISNREYKGSLVLKNGEPAVVAGMISHSEMRSMNGIPGLGSIPLLNQAMVDNNKSTEDDELMIVITPTIVGDSDRRSSPTIWLGH